MEHTFVRATSVGSVTPSSASNLFSSSDKISGKPGLLYGLYIFFSTGATAGADVDETIGSLRMSIDVDFDIVVGC